MTTFELRRTLSDPNAISREPFPLLKEIATRFNAGEEHTARDLILHALEYRDRFGPYEGILESLVREVGLFPYVDADALSLTDSIAYEYHRPANLDGAIVFHREQAEVYRRLMDGDSVILSAPTSFGKSKVIDAVIASDRYQNLVVIVPTIALIDETRRRLAQFAGKFKLITQVS
jgi:ATP-dependent helicase YprA (DUF1998 family)